MTNARTPIDSLLHVADLHFWRVLANPLRMLNKRFLGNLNVWLRRRREFCMERAEPFAKTLIDTGVRQLLLTGDLTSTSVDEEFALAARFIDILRERGLTVALLPGNHDVYTFEARRKQRFERWFADIAPDGYPARVTLLGGTPLLLVPTVCPNILSSRGRITPADVAQTRRLLDACGETVVVAAHYPLRYRTHAYATPALRQLRNAALLRQALGESGRRILYVAGHVHRFSYTRDPEYPRLYHLTTGALFRNAPAQRVQGEFSEIHVCSERFRVFLHRHQDGWRRVEQTPVS